jgi:hypothetical protein
VRRDYDIFLENNFLIAEYEKCWLQDIDERLRAWPSFSHEVAQALTFKAPNSDLSLSDIVGDYNRRYFLPMAGAPDLNCGKLRDFTSENVYTVSASVIGAITPEAIKREIDEMKRSLLNYLLKHTMGVTIEEIQDYLKSPESHFDQVMGGGSGTITSLEQFNREILQITERAFDNPSEHFDWPTFPPAFNTVVMTKLLLMKPSEV